MLILLEICFNLACGYSPQFKSLSLFERNDWSRFSIGSLQVPDTRTLGCCRHQVRKSFIKQLQIKKSDSTNLKKQHTVLSALVSSNDTQQSKS